MDSSFWAVVLLLLSLALLFAEVLIPSGGLIFFSSMVALGLALWAGWAAWWEHSPILFWAFVASSIVLIPCAVSAAIYVWPHTPIGRSMEPPTEAEVTPYVEEQRRLEKLIGQRGIALTPLTPAGMVRVGQERVHAQTEGLIVEAQSPVQVLAVQGVRVVVRALEPEELAPPAPSSPGQSPAPGAGLLDFDVPES